MTKTEYHKIPSVWKRDPANNHKTFIDGAWATPELELLSAHGVKWVGEEKVDGTNVRIIWDGHRVEFGGRTDRAQMPTFLLNYLRDTFPEGAMEEQFRDSPAVLYGEGYGAKIQKGGGDYMPDRQGFILFDVKVGEWWLKRDALTEIAGHFGVPRCPEIATGDLENLVDLVRQGFDSRLRDTPPEGLVMRPVVDLFTRRGERIICKAKIKDFPR